MNVGMAHIHAHFNSKQGKLSDEEISQVRRHTEESLRVLEAAGVKDANWLAYVLAHHEAEDGSGYPLGKTGRISPGMPRSLPSQTGTVPASPPGITASRCCPMWCCAIFS
jgi:hypothetical protein